MSVHLDVPYWLAKPQKAQRPPAHPSWAQQVPTAPTAAPQQQRPGSPLPRGLTAMADFERQRAATDASLSPVVAQLQAVTNELRRHNQIAAADRVPVRDGQGKIIRSKIAL